MAKIMEYTAEQQTEFDEWVASKPPLIQEMIKKCPPNLLYMNRQSGHRMTIVSYSENGTVTAAVTGEYNQCAFERNVFGIPLVDLEECDLPIGPVGAVLTDQKDIDNFIKAVRPIVLADRN